MRTVLVTGGAGYIGSHTVVLLQQAGIPVVVIDNLSNSNEESLRRVSKITGKPVPFVRGDVRDAKCLDTVLRDYDVEAVIHFAGLKAVGESVAHPLSYYDCNVVGAVNLLQAMQRAGVQKLVFSSSATVYGNPSEVPISESANLHPTNPYGATKAHIEDMLRDLCHSGSSWRVALLRYFNPVGAHESGLIGENPTGIPNNLMPYVARVAAGKLPKLHVFGDDYDTIDGTGVRDYIHVMDLAKGHLAVLGELEGHAELITANLGTGRGYSVLEVIREFERASGREVPYVIDGRRPGDIAECYADPAYAWEAFGWKAERSLAEMCSDQWRWEAANPSGY